MSTKRGPLWRREHDDCLTELNEKYQHTKLVDKFNKRAKKNGWPGRTSYAIKRRLYRLRILTEDNSQDNFTVSQLARQLGIPRYRVKRWYYNCTPPLEVKKIPYPNGNKGGHMVVITRAALYDFFFPKQAEPDCATHRLHLIKDVDPLNLEWLFPNKPDITELVANCNRHFAPTPVIKRCMVTGAVVAQYKTKKQAAQENYLGIHRLNSHLNTRKPLDNHLWETL